MRRSFSRLAMSIAVALSLSACGLTPTQQKWTGIAAGVLIVGAIAAHRDDSGQQVTTRQPECIAHAPNHPCQ